MEKLLKTTRNKKFVIIARRKLNSIESKISEAVINNDISYQDSIAIIIEERNYQELKESIRMMHS